MPEFVTGLVFSTSVRASNRGVHRGGRARVKTCCGHIFGAGSKDRQCECQGNYYALVENVLTHVNSSIVLFHNSWNAYNSATLPQCHTGIAGILQNQTKSGLSQGSKFIFTPGQIMRPVLKSTLFQLSVLVSLSFPAMADGIPVQAQRIDSLLVTQVLRAPATVISGNRAEIKSQVAALIDAVIKDVGAPVSHGEVLLRLDDSNAKLALAQAEASLAAIEAQLSESKLRVANAEDLLKKNFISAEELIARRANFAVLEANKLGQEVAVRVAGLELKRTVIRAPFDGVILDRQAQVGSYAQPGTPLLTVVQTAGREINVELDPRYANSIAGNADLYFDSQGQRWPVRLLRMSSIIDTSSRVVTARMGFIGNTDDGGAPIGSSGELIWNESSGLIPVNLIVQRGLSLGVFVAENNVARFIAIPDAQEGRPATMKLPADTLIVSRGHTRLQDGDKLQISTE